MGRVLLVDDQPEVRRGLRKALEWLGHEVGEAADGAKALTLLERGEWEVVVTDINMPEMNGIELILAIRARHREIPVIAFSGGGVMPKELLLANANLLGAVSTLSKPVELDQLRSAVDEALARGAAGRERREHE